VHLVAGSVFSCAVRGRGVLIVLQHGQRLSKCFYELVWGEHRTKYHKNLFGATLQYRLITMMIFHPLSASILVGTNLVIANASKISVFVDEEGKKLEVLEEELNGVGTTPGMASGDFSSEVSSQILDANPDLYCSPFQPSPSPNAPINSSSPGKHIWPK
jgi:hypothetical protein